MEKEIIIHSNPKEIELAIVEDQRLVEIHRQKKDFQFTVGDIFLGSIKQLRQDLNATFVDIGDRSDAFLHYTDLGPQINSVKRYTNLVINQNHKTHSLKDFRLEPENPKDGKIRQVFDRREFCLVQILKEPISTKGPRLTCEITLPGRFVVLTPFEDMVAVSKKIMDDDERKRLKTLVESIKPAKFGVIIRTAAKGKRVADLHDEIRMLENRWKLIFEELQKEKKPRKLLSEIDKTGTIIRDMLNDSFNRITMDFKPDFDATQEYLKNIAPEKTKILKHYKGNKHIFDQFHINKQIKSSFGKAPTLKSGAYIIIEHTEAMHVIDVNSGPKSNRENQEETALRVNVETAKEIARQLRLRDIGGLIIIDFIDMRKGENKSTLYKAMREYMRNDRAQHTILPLSKFGLMQITRQRVKPSVKIDTMEVCPSCDGSGKINASTLITEDIARDLDYIMNNMPNSKLSLHVHPFVYAFLKKGLKSEQVQWFMKYKKWIKINAEPSFNLNKYKFFNNFEDEIRLN